MLAIGTLPELNVKSDVWAFSNKKNQQALLEGELPALHWKQGDAKSYLMVQYLKNYIPALEENFSKSRKEDKAKARSYFALTYKVNYHHRQEGLKHRQQVLTDLKGCIAYYKHTCRWHKKRFAWRPVLGKLWKWTVIFTASRRSGGRSVTSTYYNPASRQAKKNTEESHNKESEAREAKYMNLLEEQSALVEHL